MKERLTEIKERIKRIRSCTSLSLILDDLERIENLAKYQQKTIDDLVERYNDHADRIGGPRI